MGYLDLEEELRLWMNKFHNNITTKLIPALDDIAKSLEHSNRKDRDPGKFREQMDESLNHLENALKGVLEKYEGVLYLISLKGIISLKKLRELNSDQKVDIATRIETSYGHFAGGRALFIAEEDRIKKVISLAKRKKYDQFKAIEKLMKEIIGLEDKFRKFHDDAGEPWQNRESYLRGAAPAPAPGLVPPRGGPPPGFPPIPP